jgi:hypothetical protein
MRRHIRDEHLYDLAGLTADDQPLQHLEDLNEQYQEVLTYLDSFRHDLIDSLDSPEQSRYIDNAESNLEMALGAIEQLWRMTMSDRTRKQLAQHQQQQILGRLCVKT